MVAASEAAGDERASTGALLEMIMGFRTTQLIYVAAKLGIADLLANDPRSSSELAQACGVDERNLYRVLRALASMGIFEELDDRRFALTPTAQLLRKDVPGSVRGVALLYGDQPLWQAYGALLQAVQSGKTAFDIVHGASLFDYLAEHAEAAQVFQGAMTGFSDAHSKAILAAYDFGNARHVVDIGGGEGALLIATLEAYPALQGTLFDMPSTIERVRQQHDDATGAWARCTLVAGDFFEAVPAGGDLYMLKQVIHDWQDAESIAILHNCRKALEGSRGEPGKLLIFDRVIVPGQKAADAKLFDINMMVSAGGLQRSQTEFAALLEAAGFRLTRVIATESPMSIVEALPV